MGNSNHKKIHKNKATNSLIRNICNFSFIYFLFI